MLTSIIYIHLMELVLFLRPEKHIHDSKFQFTCYIIYTSDLSTEFWDLITTVYGEHHSFRARQEERMIILHNHGYFLRPRVHVTSVPLG